MTLRRSVPSSGQSRTAKNYQVARGHHAVAARQNFSDLLNQVQYRNDSVVITRDGKPVAALVDVDLFERIRCLREDFQQLTDTLGQSYAGAPRNPGAARSQEAPLMRVVIDTNLWLSGLMLPTSVPGLRVRAVVAGEMVAVTSEPLRRFLTELHYVTEFVDLAGVVAEVPKDRRDDFILPTFIASGAGCLISGDSDLADLRAQFAILTAREFCDQHLR